MFALPRNGARRATTPTPNRNAAGMVPYQRVRQLEGGLNRLGPQTKWSAREGLVN